MKELLKKLVFRVDVRLFTFVFGHPCDPRNCELSEQCNSRLVVNGNSLCSHDCLYIQG